MRIFAKKPSREQQDMLGRLANTAATHFSLIMTDKKSNTLRDEDHLALDLEHEENREAIRAEVIEIIREQALEPLTETEIRKRIDSISSQCSGNSIFSAAYYTIFNINTISYLASVCFNNFPKYKPLQEMVDNLAQIGCSGTAQTLGNELPEEVDRTWPYFAYLFKLTRERSVLMWPCV